jgi:hypothetical protein
MHAWSRPTSLPCRPLGTTDLATGTDAEHVAHSEHAIHTREHEPTHWKKQKYDRRRDCFVRKGRDT